MPLNQRSKISQAHQPTPLRFPVCGVKWRRQNQLQILNLHFGGLGFRNCGFQSEQVIGRNSVRFCQHLTPAILACRFDRQHRQPASGECRVRILPFARKKEVRRIALLSRCLTLEVQPLRLQDRFDMMPKCPACARFAAFCTLSEKDRKPSTSAVPSIMKPFASRSATTCRSICRNSASSCSTAIASSEMKVPRAQPSGADSIWPVAFMSLSMACLSHRTKPGASAPTTAASSLATARGSMSV